MKRLSLYIISTLKALALILIISASVLVFSSCGKKESSKKPKIEDPNDEYQITEEDIALAQKFSFVETTLDGVSGYSIFRGLADETEIVFPKTYMGKPVLAISDEAFLGSKVENITFSNTIKTIGERAFYECENLQEVNFEQTSVLSIIGKQAFSRTEISAITFPASVKIIGEEIFYLNSNLTSVQFESNSQLETIGAGAFTDTSIESITIPASVKTVGASAFFLCDLLSNLSFGEGSVLETIGAYAFAQTGITNISIPSSVKTINQGAFSQTSITNITLPASLTFLHGDFVGSNSTVLSVTFEDNCQLKTLQDSTFEYWFALASVDFGTNSQLETIETQAFKSTVITEITIPSSVKVISSYAFEICTKLETLIFESGSQLETIGECAFSGCILLSSITIPASVNEIGNSIFYDCRSIVSITVDSANITYKSEGDCLLDISGTVLIAGCTSSIIPSTVVTISIRSFFGTGLSNITIPSSVSTIGENAFAFCQSLSVLTFEAESQLQSIGAYAFDNAEITSIRIFGDLENITGICDKISSKLSNISGVTLFVDSTVLSSITNTWGFVSVQSIPD